MKRPPDSRLEGEPMPLPKRIAIVFAIALVLGSPLLASLASIDPDGFQSSSDYSSDANAH